MKEKDIFGEQPISDDATSATSVGFDNVSPDNPAGSPIGKFKDVESLYKSYSNLQSEFTKKCQAYNELLKEKENSDNVNTTPQYEQENWQISVDNFLNKYPQAKKYSKEIANVLSSDKDNHISLEMAYSMVLEEENQKLTSILSDEKHIVQAISPKIKEDIVKQYLKEVNLKSPFLFGSESGSNVVATYKRPMSVNEAGEMAKKLFK